ncbi:SAC3 family protein B-like isoform X1 [Pyrus communis]|uniref:SAC3 family protein B-like isoform X1 n=2 Tax=Pyrus communis TaxID=23211 RepID=UPI0035BF9A5E
MYPGFGKASGPTGPPGSQPLFGNLGGGRPPSPSPPTTPPFSGAAPLRSPSRGPEAPGQLYSLPLGFERVRPAASQPFPSAGVYRRPESSGQLHSPPLAFERARPAASPSHPSAGVHRSTESHPTWDHGQRSSFKNYDTQAHQRPSAVTSFVVSRNSGTSVTAKVSRFQDTEGIRSPPFLSKDVNFRNSTQGAPRSHLVAPRIRSPPLVSYEDLHPSVGVEEPSVSSVGFNTRSNTNFSTPDSRVHQKSLQSASNTISEAAAGNATNIPVAKRTRSPPLLPEDQVFHGNSHATQEGTEREMQAKTKRLARFKVELSKTPQNNPDNVEPGVSANRHEQSNVERNKLAQYKSTELAMGGSDGNALPEDEGVESSGIIIGLCPDMCPESERAERERKGDLDQYERLDGDRNQTSMSLAVKKYNRTAERDANLIRPMPILQKTIDYLLNLLDQPYNDRFLRIYNFLWDRMRAIRMDLRMQHIFNQEAITMLEQMIRLHIIVMHELCEYSRGEGFAEGFDAHLNIEQMNKTSVELFQLYDDHRKKGINIPTEKEFRGYYALLKLDKHPGYMVEPAELSLDLAKMTPEIRQTSEVLFARDVARACRTGNFIAFFRLARKASYLQSCLMHAHFSKLRTQALASIHAGLQNNQGLPIADGAKWLAMEEDEIESLSEYHGFVIKSFQEPYIVKEGPFLNGDEDYPTKCSKLVDMKKSRRIVEDVLASSQVIPSSSKATKKTQLTKSNKPEPKTISYVEKKSPVRRAPAIEVTKPLHEVDEEMPNFEAFSPPKDARQKQQMIQAPIFSSPEDSRQKQQTIQTPIFGIYSEDSPKVAAVSPSPWGFSSFTRQPDKVGTIEKRNYDVLFSNSPERSMHSGMERMPLQIESKTSVQERSVGIYSSGKEYPDIQIMVTDNLEAEEPSDLHQIDENNDVMESSQQEEIAEAKLKLILRLWKRRALKLRQLREKKQLAANAALNSLSLGPPIQLKTDQPSISGEFDIDLVLRERFKNHGRSWSRLNVSDVIADILGTRNPDARCLCWKTVVCSQMNNLEGDDLGQRSHFLGAAPWLLSKLMPSANDADNDDEDLVVSSPGVSIWKKWVRGQAGSDLNCYLSVVKDASFDNLSQSVSGASAVLFLTSESISWNLQKVRLHNLLMLIPYGSCLPLLILSGSYKNNVDDSTIVDNLGLRDLDKSRISSFLVVPLVESQQMGQLDGFFSDNQLREGLRWLASESPLQPILHHVKTLELVLTHLNSSLEPLDRMKDYEAGPDNCILAFNEALDWSQKEIAAAVKSNPSSWPCPEIALLEEFSDEYRVVKWCLPSVGWSSAEKVEPLMSALGDCRLPAFPDHISWLPQCCNAGKEIENLRGELENGLIEYLTNSSKMMGRALAIKEAHVMLQRSCRLQRHDSCCYIVPNWVMIFRRIFNWRLMGLANGASSSAYVLESPHLNAVFENLGKLGLEDAGPSPCYLNQPSLDEIIEVGRAPLSSHRGQPLVEPGVAVPETSPNGEIHETPNTTDWMEDERSLAHDDQAEIENVSHENGRLENAGGEMVVTGEVGKGAEKLSILLEQCDMLQNVIDEKLSIFF